MILLGRKAMTNLDSLLKSKDITLPTKVCIVKAIFPVVMYRYESWTIRKTECQRIDFFWAVVLEKTLESPLDSKEIKPINPKYSLERLMLKLKLQHFGHLVQRADSLEKNPDAGKDWRQKEKRVTEDEMVGWHERLNAHEFGWTLGVDDGQGGLVCCNSWGCKESDTTERVNWTELNELPWWLRQ